MSLRVFSAQRVGLVAIVHGADFHGALAHTALRVELVEKQLGAQVELHAQLCGGAREGSGLAKHDATFGLGVCKLKAPDRGGAQADGKLPASQALVVHGEILSLRK